MEKETENENPFEIRNAAIKDEFCNYSFEIKSGVGLGDTHGVKGSGIIDDDMITVFEKFNAHLACIDDMFKHNGVEVENIDSMHNNELTGLYVVTGFKVKGNDENEAIILVGTKHISCSGDRINIETPRIPLDDLSSYKWYNELRDILYEARAEVLLYKNGKCTIPAEPEKEDPKQLKITEGGHDIDIEMEGAKV